MKYSLRSLMIGITLFCVVLGSRVEFLRCKADFHKLEAQRNAIAFGFNADDDPDEIPITHPAAFGDEWSYHARLAREYRAAVYRPWTIVKE